MEVKQIVAGNFQTNVYIVYDVDTRLGVVIDPGEDAETILQFIQKEQLKIEKILLTHAHFDHIGAVNSTKKHTGATAVACSEELPFMSSAKNNLSVFFKQPLTLEVDLYVADGDVVSVGEIEFELLHTPGHTPGSCCYHIKKEKKLFSGDTLFFESIGRTDLPHGSTKDIMASITDTLFRLPGDTDVYPGHDQRTTIQHEKDNNPYVSGRGITNS